MESYQLRSARHIMGMTQRELAENLQVREHTVASWENERLPIRRITQMAVLHLLNTSGKSPTQSPR